MTDLLSDHLGNIIIETPDYANYDERLAVMTDLEQRDPADEQENGRIIFNIIFNHPAFDIPDSRDCHDPRYLEMLEHVKSAIPQHSLDIIDGAQHRSSNYDDQGHPTRDY